MSLVLALDLSSSTGWCLVDGTKLTTKNGIKFPKILDKGIIDLDKTVKSHGSYPFSLLNAAKELVVTLADLVYKHTPNVILIEEIVLGRNRISQKFLGYLHCLLLQELEKKYDSSTVLYVNPSEWRKSLKIGLTKEDKARNSKLSRAKSQAKRQGKKLDKKALGIKGRFGKKHASIRFINENLGWALKAKDDDIADAACQAISFFNGITYCDGK